MKNLVLLSKKDRDLLVNPRKGESKFGEHVKLLPNLSNIYEDIANLDVDYVIFGIRDDIGVQANYGEPGTRKAWEATLNSILNTQSNIYTNANRVAILGHLNYQKKQNELTQVDLNKRKSISKLRLEVENIDKDVNYLVSCIIRTGKTPIIIGGGHNNSYGNIKGTSLALNNKINVINLDAHTDFRPEEGRHSGNGFSYAFAEGFLKRYFIFGLHENYTSSKILKTIKKLKDVKFNTYESIEVRNELDFNDQLKYALEYISKDAFGIEIDCDAIENMPSSAMTPSGFSMKQTRQFVHYFGQHNNAKFLHICEASPTKKSKTKVGKAISYFITDFIRAHGS
ncbi:formimidoylglutamase [Winogradskyella sp. A2]|uniref:formimidoylglutamase n=1 Tax=Winogradskyella sp. A2 TaxID=3366944 RepID=UPI00398C5B80